MPHSSALSPRCQPLPPPPGYAPRNPRSTASQNLHFFSAAPEIPLKTVKLGAIKRPWTKNLINPAYAHHCDIRDMRFGIFVTDGANSFVTLSHSRYADIDTLFSLNGSEVSTASAQSTLYECTEY